MFEGEVAILSELLRDAQSGQRRAIAGRSRRSTSGRASRSRRSSIDFGLITEEQLLQALAEHLNLEYMNLEDMDFDQAVLRSIPSSAARMYGAVPVSVNGNTVTVAVMDPYNPQLVERVSFILGKDVHVAVAPVRSRSRTAIERYFGEDSGSLKDVLTDMEDQLTSAEPSNRRQRRVGRRLWRTWPTRPRSCVL